jgi:formylmethanofuran dehydrogenase subunit E
MDQKLWERCVEFHGHECPGLAIGFRACEIAKEKMNLTFSKDEELVCITENDACGVDAVQVITGCTMGKGNLIHRPRGKMAFSFIRRDTGEKIRIVLLPSTGEMTREERQKHILNAPAESVFQIKTPSYELPEKARLFKSIVCNQCGENTAEHKIRLQSGDNVCLDCFNEYNNRW